MMVQLMDI